jgi:prevent-host-death family protein
MPLHFSFLERTVQLDWGMQCGYNSYMKTSRAVTVGVRELKNHLTTYLRIAKDRCEVIVTERGKPVAVIQPITRDHVLKTLEAKLAAMAARGEISTPEGRLVPHIKRVKIKGRPLSETILADRR